MTYWIFPKRSRPSMTPLWWTVAGAILVVTLFAGHGGANSESDAEHVKNCTNAFQEHCKDINFAFLAVDEHNRTVACNFYVDLCRCVASHLWRCFNWFVDTSDSYLHSPLNCQEFVSKREVRLEIQGLLQESEWRELNPVTEASVTKTDKHTQATSSLPDTGTDEGTDEGTGDGTDEGTDEETDKGTDESTDESSEGKTVATTDKGYTVTNNRQGENSKHSAEDSSPSLALSLSLLAVGLSVSTFML